MVINYKKLNLATGGDSYMLPRKDFILEKIKGCNWFSYKLPTQTSWRNKTINSFFMSTSKTLRMEWFAFRTKTSTINILEIYGSIFWWFESYMSSIYRWYTYFKSQRCRNCSFKSQIKRYCNFKKEIKNLSKRNRIRWTYLKRKWGIKFSTPYPGENTRFSKRAF